MRHIGGLFIGFFGTLLGATLLGQGYWEAVQAALGSPDDRQFAGVGWLLAGAGVLGLVVITRRLSGAAPLIGGLVLLGSWLLEWSAPGEFFESREPEAWAGFVALLGNHTMLVAGVLMVACALTAGRRAATPPVYHPPHPAPGYPPRPY